MKHVEVESSNIFSIGYNSNDHRLEVTFRKRDNTAGATYSYSPISQEGHKVFMNSESKGKFFNEHIKDNPMIEMKKIS